MSCCASGDPIKEIPNQWQFPFCQRTSTKTFRVINKNISTSTKTCQNRPPFFCEYKKYTSFFFFYIHCSIQSPFLTVQLLNRCHCLKPLFLCYHLHMASLSTSHSFCLFKHTCTTLTSRYLSRQIWNPFHFFHFFIIDFDLIQIKKSRNRNIGMTQIFIYLIHSHFYFWL